MIIGTNRARPRDFVRFVANGESRGLCSGLPNSQKWRTVAVRLCARVRSILNTVPQRVASILVAYDKRADVCSRTQDPAFTELAITLEKGQRD